MKKSRSSLQNSASQQRNTGGGALAKCFSLRRRDRKKHWSKALFRHSLVESLETRQLLAADILPSALLATSPGDDVAMGPARSSETSLPSLDASNSQLAELAAEVPDYDLEGVLSRTAVASDLLSQRSQSISASLGVPDLESASQLQTVINTLGNDVDSQLATTSAWSDFHNRTRGRAASVAGVQAIEQMSLNPQALESKLLGLHSFGLADNPFGDSVALPAEFPSSELANAPVLVGASCLRDGTHKTASALIAEGEDGDDSGIPDVSMPGMVFSGSGGLDAFVPDPGITSSTDTFGAFNTSTTPDNANFDLPGTHWYHNVVASYTNADHWSVTETLILSFNLSEDIPLEDDDSSSSDDDPAVGPNDGPIVSSTDSASAWVERSGFVILVIHANKGISAPAAAGVTWSADVNYKDSIGFHVEGGGGSTISPNPDAPEPDDSGSGGSGTGSGGSGDYPGDDDGSGGGDDGSGGADDELTLPADTSGSSSWEMNIGIIATLTGSFSASSSPQLVGADIETDVTLSADSDLGGKLLLGGGWAASSESGDINDPSTKPEMPVDPDQSPAPNESGSGGNDYNIPSDGVADSGMKDAAGGGPDADPLPEPEGDGHSFGATGGFNTNLGNNRTSGLSLSAKVRNNSELTSLAGELRSGFKNKYGDDFADNQILLFSDSGREGDSVWSGSIFFMNNVAPNIAASMGNDIKYDLGLDAEGEVLASLADDNEHYSASGGDVGVNYEKLDIEVVSYSSSPIGWVFSRDTFTEGHGNRGSSSGSVTVSAGSEDSGELELDWDGSSHEFNTTTSKQIIFTQNASGHEKQYWDDSLSWSHYFSSDGSVDNELGSDGEGDPTGGGGGESTETLSYNSHRGTKARWEDEYLLEIIDSDRYAEFNKTIETGGDFDASSDSNPDPTTTPTGDDKVRVWGHDWWDHYGYDGNGVLEYHDFDHMDIATGSGPCQGDGGNDAGTCSADPATYDPRTDIERYLDGTISELPDGSGSDDDGIGTLPPGYVYPSVDLGQDTWVAWVAGQRGDGFDQGINAAAGFADSLSFNATWVWRDSVWGTDYVDYDSGAYIGGTYAGTAVGLVSAGVGVAKGIVKLANSTDELGRCANIIAKLWRGKCFVPGTLVSLGSMPRGAELEDQVWNATESQWCDSMLPSLFEPDREELGAARGGPFGEPTALAAGSTQAIASVSPQLQIPIEDVPLGARVLTKNPRRWEYDDSFAEPNEATWRKVTLSLELASGGRFEAELLRPASWIGANGLSTYHQIPFQIDELDVKGLAQIESIEPCPPIATGEGSVVTARFKTERHVEALSRVEFTDAGGRSEKITGTNQHPIWSLDRNTWIGLGELEEGERVAAQHGPVLVTSVEQLSDTSTVYNIEVAGEHVYQVGELGILVHNACNSYELGKAMAGTAKAAAKMRAQGNAAGHVVPAVGFSNRAANVVKAANDARKKLAEFGIGVNDAANGFWTTSSRHLGTHTNKYLLRMWEVLKDKTTTQGVMNGLKQLIQEAKNGNF